MKCEHCKRKAIKGLRYCFSHRDMILNKLKLEEPKQNQARSSSQRENRTETKGQ